MTLLSVDPSDLSSLDQGRGVTFIRKLLWAEAVKCGVGQKTLSVPGCINTADGGIDASITESDSVDDRLIPKGLVGYQIKTGTGTYSPKDCKKEIHVNNDLQNPLKPEVKRVLDEGGIYFLILLKDVPTRKEGGCLKALKEDIKRLGYNEDQVRIIASNALSSILEEHLSVAVWFKQIPLEFIPYETWEKQLNDGVFLFDEPRRKISVEVQGQIKSPQESARMIRMIGLPGIGKTRLVNQILSPDEFKNRVIYIEDIEKFLSSSTCNTITTYDTYNLIIVLDDCNHSQYERAEKMFSRLSDRITVIALFNEGGGTSIPLNRDVYEIGPLGENEIAQILRDRRPLLPESLINTLAKFSEGYPRIATLLHESYQSNKPSFSENPLISSQSLLTRLIGGKYATGSDIAEKNHRLLMWLSVFSKIGYRDKLVREINWICEIAGIAKADLGAILAYQKERRILQGDYYISVTPFMLKVSLINEWWRTNGYSASFVRDMFSAAPEEMRHDLAERFFSELSLAPRNEEIKRLAKEILNQEGFNDIAILDSKFGSSFFLKLANVAPDSALDILEKVLAAKGEEAFGSLKEGRRNILYAVIELLSSERTYKRAYELAKALALHEHESYANNSEGVAKDFFSLIPSYTFTEVPFEDRWEILNSLFESEDSRLRLFAIDACNEALKNDGFVRMIPGQKNQISVQTYDVDTKVLAKTAIDVWGKVWEKLVSCLNSSDTDQRVAAAKALLKHAYSLSDVIGMGERVRSGLKHVSELDFHAKKEALACVSRIIHYNRQEMTDDEKKAWLDLKVELTGTDFSSRLRRYVEMNFFEDSEDGEGGSHDVTKEKIKLLAQEMYQQPDLLDKEIYWLIESPYPNAYSFGFELGQYDDTNRFIEILRSHQARLDKKIALFFSGYLKAYHERDSQKWEVYIHSILNDPSLAKVGSELAWRSGMTEELGALLMEKAESGEISTDEFGLFGLGGAFLKLKPTIVERMLALLLKVGTELSITNALDLAHSFYMPSGGAIAPSLPEKLILELITHPILFGGISLSRNTMADYYWTELTQKFLDTNPEEYLKIAQIVIDNFGQDGTILSGFHTETQKIINGILAKHPEEAWEMISKKLGPPIDSQSFHLDRWLRGGDGFATARYSPIVEIPIQSLFEWVDKDVEKRAWYLAHFVPNQLFHNQSGKPCYAREVLIKYGDRDDVRRNLAANFSTEGFSGPASEHYQRKKNALIAFKEKETSNHVLRWIDEYLDSLDESIKRAQIEEEKGGF